MIIFINRILYSHYCFKRWINGLMDRIFRPLIIPICRLMYTWDPFGVIRKKNKNLDAYIKNVNWTTNEVSNNLDYGMGIMDAQVALVSSFVPYLILIISLLIKYLKPDSISEEFFKNILIIAFCISSLINYLAAFRNDKFKLYFKNFEKEKSHLKWHFITVIFYAGAIYSFWLSLQLS